MTATGPGFIMTASSKGGVGKSTVASGLARAFCRRGLKVLVCDMDFGSACLDMLFGVQDECLYTLADAAKGVCSPDTAAVPAGESGRLFLMCAPADGASVFSGIGEKRDGEIEISDICAAVKKAAEDVEADRVILDTGAGISGGAAAAATIADTALVIATHTPVSVRAAQTTALRLVSMGVKDTGLIINPFDARAMLDRRRTSMSDIIDLSCLRLRGVVPYDEKLALSQEEAPGGAHSCKPNISSTQAFDNIAARLDGEDVPLLWGIKNLRKKRKKLFR